MTASRIWRRSLVVGLLVVAVVIALLWLLPSNHYLYLPDPAKPVDPLVRVPDEEAESGEGGFYLVDVLVRRASVLERLFPGLEEGSTLVPDRVFNPRGLPDEVRRRESLNEMSVSQQVAIAVALRSLGYDVDSSGAEVSSIRVGTPADGKLRAGDVIVEALDERVGTPEDLRRIMTGTRPGDTVTLTVLRGGSRRELEVGTEPAPDDRSRAVMGVVVQPELRFPVDVRIDAGDIGGPSAGLAFALHVFDELGREVDEGRTIAVTGELDLDGNVSEIGGVKQKTIGAKEAGADVFVVPDGNAAEARRYADGLEVVAVSSFDEALAELATG